jgi:hypothetical protein
MNSELPASDNEHHCRLSPVEASHDEVQVIETTIET